MKKFSLIYWLRIRLQNLRIVWKNRYICFIRWGDERFSRGWYFMDETEDLWGPYRTERKAERGFEVYTNSVLS